MSDSGSGNRSRPDLTPILELGGVHAGYGRIEVLHGVDLVVPRGTVVALLGPNGAGKTTALRVASCQLAPTRGHVHLDGRHVNGAAPDAVARAGVCTVPEQRGVFPNLTVAEHLRLFSFAGGATQVEIREQTFARFPRLGQRPSQLAGTLSGGEQQMLALARALSTGPRLVLIDELSAGLAPLVVEELYDIVAGVAREGLAVVVVEQHTRAALSVADYAVVMARGRIVAVGEPQDVQAALAEAYLGGAA